MSEQLLKEILHEVKELSKRVENVENEISNVNSELDEIKKNINNVSHDLSNVKLHLNDNRDSKKTMLHRQGETNAKLVHLSKDAQQLYELLTQLKENHQSLQIGQAVIIEEIENVKTRLKSNFEKITE